MADSRLRLHDWKRMRSRHAARALFQRLRALVVRLVEEDEKGHHHNHHGGYGTVRNLPRERHVEPAAVAVPHATAHRAALITYVQRQQQHGALGEQHAEENEEFPDPVAARGLRVNVAGHNHQVEEDEQERDDGS